MIFIFAKRLSLARVEFFWEWVREAARAKREDKAIPESGGYES